ncbi:redoxin domain-containing protein [Pseudomonas sp. LS44]|uniref:glutathione peroxidase n=1 Tax=Pseudomonas sp. LS44 TaxID=1357074 RepID=UPI00215B6494|nr:redoxin domain-containing protein [Pseudomonas sp. LS44]UVE16527.1 redoxin domain-containing protein [Pseudomonas sp. LS44]
MLIRSLFATLLLATLTGPVWASECPPLLQGELPKLRAKENIDLCQRFAGKPLVIVNTASHCGFAPQFKGLEALYKEYQAQGLEVIGVPSNDFKQEDANTEETAKVCYVNYGVTFTMTEPQKVTGAEAIPLFKQLAEQSGQPRWNFYKYVVDRQGKVVASFSSLTKPDSDSLREAVKQAIASQP